jgi:type IV pilus assembly protein PilV
MLNKQKASLRRNKGFSLLEVLITIVIVTIGLLGVAGMQIASIKLADVANTRTTGAVFVSEMFERMSGNTEGVAAIPSVYDVAFGATSARTDVNAWKQNIAAALPSGDGSITVVNDPSCAELPATEVSFLRCRLVTISVRWDDFRGKRGATQSNLVTFSSTSRI